MEVRFWSPAADTEKIHQLKREERVFIREQVP